MKIHQIASKRRTQRKLQLTAPSSIRRRLMSCHLNKSLRDQYKIRCLPIKRGDEVKILKGKSKGKSGKVVQVYRKEMLYLLIKLIEKNKMGNLYFYL